MPPATRPVPQDGGQSGSGARSIRAPLRESLKALAAEFTGAALTDRREAFLDSLHKGSLVYLPRYRQRVLVHKVDRSKREVSCKLGSMKIRVAFEEVTPYESL